MFKTDAILSDSTGKNAVYCCGLYSYFMAFMGTHHCADGQLHAVVGLGILEEKDVEIAQWIIGEMEKKKKEPVFVVEEKDKKHILSIYFPYNDLPLLKLLQFAGSKANKRHLRRFQGGRTLYLLWRQCGIVMPSKKAVEVFNQQYQKEGFYYFTLFKLTGGPDVEASAVWLDKRLEKKFSSLGDGQLDDKSILKLFGLS